MFHVNERHRVKSGPFGSDSSYGNNGHFVIDRGRTRFIVVASDGIGWEHVSVHVYCFRENKERTPTWAEMCFIKDIYWDDTDCVVQYHPAKSEYVNMHKHTLHLWRPTEVEFPIPDKIQVGFNID